MRKIAVFGSTGSIGTQALDVVRRHPDLFQVTALSAHKNAEKLFEQVREFRVPAACLSGARLENIPPDLGFCTFYGQAELEKLATQADADDALIAVVGAAGLSVTLAARKSGKRILLANKETLVCGGEMVMKACAPQNGQIMLLPVDSEHSAIFQCLQADPCNPVKTIFLTASGGPFRTWKKEDILKAKKAQALRHPTWVMGQKITVDSATMVNKALEIIEAKWLFDVNPDQIRVLVHPESILHSAVGFADGAVLAQMGVPDMRVPIAYAMSYPKRIETGVCYPDFAALSGLHFEKGDEERFPSLRMAYDALRAGGASCCILNAANEVAVDAFLREQTDVGGIYRIIEETLNALGYRRADTLEDILEADHLARNAANKVLHRMTGENQ